MVSIYEPVIKYQRALVDDIQMPFLKKKDIHYSNNGFPMLKQSELIGMSMGSLNLVVFLVASLTISIWKREKRGDLKSIMVVFLKKFAN